MKYSVWTPSTPPTTMDSNGKERIKYKLPFDGSITRKSPTPMLVTTVLRISWSYLETPTPMDSNGLQWTPMDSNGLQWTPLDSNGKLTIKTYEVQKNDVSIQTI